MPFAYAIKGLLRPIFQRQKQWPTLYLAAIILLTAGCTVTPDKPGKTTKRSGFTHWQLSGKVGIKQGNEAKSAYIRWKNADQHYQITLNGVFGLGKVVITKDAEHVNLKTKNESASAATAEELLYKTTGIDLPVKGLQYWIKATSSPFATHSQTQFNEKYQLTRLAESGWVIRYSKYQKVDDIDLPHKIVVTRKDTTITIIIKQWKQT